MNIVAWSAYTALAMIAAAVVWAIAYVAIGEHNDQHEDP